VYRGIRTPDGQVVTVNGQDLPLRLDLWNHSPDGFNWGYGGSGPAQLALAMLAYEYSDAIALALHQQFKWKLVSSLPDIWEVTSAKVYDVFCNLKVS
jgi:uncharacterized protein (DUF2249 family)